MRFPPPGRRDDLLVQAKRWRAAAQALGQCHIFHEWDRGKRAGIRKDSLIAKYGLVARSDPGQARSKAHHSPDEPQQRCASVYENIKSSPYAGRMSAECIDNNLVGVGWELGIRMQK